MSLLWPESARKPNVEPMRGNVGHPVRSPPRRVNNLASVVRVVTAFRSPICYCQDGCGTTPPPGGSFLAVLGTRQPAVCGRQSASVCGMFLAPQRNRRYRLKREDLHGNLCAWRRCRCVLRRMRPGAWGRDSRNRSGIGKNVTFRSVTGEEKMRGVKRDRFASEA